MDYLKCNHCAHLNVIKTEYQTFCSECKKKMNNNYSNWKALHPEQSFDDFKEKVCISESDLQSISELNTKPKKKSLKFYLGLIKTVK